MSWVIEIWGPHLLNDIRSQKVIKIKTLPDFVFLDYFFDFRVHVSFSENLVNIFALGLKLVNFLSLPLVRLYANTNIVVVFEDWLKLLFMLKVDFFNLFWLIVLSLDSAHQRQSISPIVNRPLRILNFKLFLCQILVELLNFHFLFINFFKRFLSLRLWWFVSMVVGREILLWWFSVS